MKKSILITGASGNLGSAVVRKFQEEGYTLYAIARGPEGLIDGVQFANVDLTQEPTVGDYLRELTQKDPELKSAILLVGAFALGGLKETDGAALEKMIKLNFHTAYYVVRALLPHFEQAGGGQFVLIGSRPGFQPQDAVHSVAYGLSKAMVHYLAEVINAYGKGKGIRASVVIPSTIDTPQNRESMPDADFSKWVPAEGIADAIYFLFTEPGQLLRETVIKVYHES